jgi:hypothetical protein
LEASLWVVSRQLFRRDPTFIPLENTITSTGC